MNHLRHCSILMPFNRLDEACYNGSCCCCTRMDAGEEGVMHQDEPPACLYCKVPLDSDDYLRLASLDRQHAVVQTHPQRHV